MAVAHITNLYHTKTKMMGQRQGSHPHTWRRSTWCPDFQRGMARIQCAPLSSSCKRSTPEGGQDGHGRVG